CHSSSARLRRTGSQSSPSSARTP
ncbi:MAG: hypothetical protein AVDCRST_MAG19-1130, partial [uncultured Thermomicrobiales bacterium]